MKKSKKSKSTIFWTAEALLLACSAVFAFTVVGYRTIALSLGAIAVLVAIYRLISLYGRKNAKGAHIIKIVLTSLVCLGLAFFGVIEAIVISSAHTDADPEAPYLVVLGSGVNGTSPSLSLQYRLIAAKEYLDEYPGAKAVVTGGQGPGEDISEAECMRLWLTERGVSEDRIIVEDKATSTAENMQYSLEKISADGGNPSGKVAVLSEEYHIYRAKYYARMLGADAVGVAAHTRLPVLMVNYFIREAFGVAAMWLL